MTADELCKRTSERLHEMGIGSIVPGGEHAVLYVATPRPCIVVCRARVRKQALQVMRRAGSLPVLLVRNERDIERLAMLLSYNATDPESDLLLSAMAMWRAREWSNAL